MNSQAQGRNRRFPRLRYLLVVAGAASVALAGAAACAANVDEKPPAEEVTVKELTKERGRHFRGPMRLVLETVREHASPTAAQLETLAAIEADLHTDRKTRRALKQKLKLSAANVVRAGTADSKEFDSSVAEAMKVFEERVQRHADALEEIHGTLTPAQRAAVATAFRARIDEKYGPDPKNDRDMRQHDGFKRFAAHLALSTLQIDKLEAIKKQLVGEKRELRPSREELTALVDAFEGDDFRTALDEFQSKKTAILRTRLEEAGARTNTVLAVFTPEQRGLLADMIQKGPKKVLFGERAGQEESGCSQ